MKKTYYFLLFTLSMTLVAACSGSDTALPPIEDPAAEEIVTSEIGLCDNASDDDGDGAIDCDDSECVSDEPCVIVENTDSAAATVVSAETNCSDGLIDCKDSDCALNATIEISGDGIDQNCDGFDFVAIDENVKWVDANLGSDKDVDGNPNKTCSVDLPCKTIEHSVRGSHVGNIVALMHGQYVPSRDVYLNKGVSLLGGFFKDANGNVLRNHTHQPALIHLDSDVNILISPDGEHDRDVVTVDGVTILGKYVTSTPVTGKIQVVGHPHVNLSRLTVVVDSEDVTTEASAYAIKVDAITVLPEMKFSLLDSTVRIGQFASTATSVNSLPVSLNNSAVAVLTANLSGNMIHCGNMSITAKVHCLAISGLESSMPLNLKLIDNTIHMGAKNPVSGSFGYGVVIDSLTDGRFTATGNTVKASSKDTSIGMFLHDAQDITIADNHFIMQDQGREIIAVRVENSNAGNHAMIRQNIFDLGKATSSQALYLTATSSQILNNAFLQDEVTTEANNISFAGSDDVEQLTVSNNIFSNASVLAKNIYIVGELYNGSSCGNNCTNIKAIMNNDFMFHGSRQDLSFYDETGVTPESSSASDCTGFTTAGTVTSQACLDDYLIFINAVTPARVTHNLSVPPKMGFDGEKHQWVLASDSRLIDAGAVAGNIDTDAAADFYGQTRVVDGHPNGTATIDIGPIEYQIVAE